MFGSVNTYPFLDELERALVLGHLEQLHSTPLVRREAAHLADHVAHKLGVFGQTLKHKNGTLNTIIIKHCCAYGQCMAGETTGFMKATLTRFSANKEI